MTMNNIHLFGTLHDLDISCDTVTAKVYLQEDLIPIKVKVLFVGLTEEERKHLKEIDAIGIQGRFTDNNIVFVETFASVKEKTWTTK